MAEPDKHSTDVASIFFGFFIALWIFTATKAVRQTSSIWRRRHTLWNRYVIFIWTEVFANVVFAVTTYLYIRGVQKPSLAYFTGIVIMWAVLTQLLLQIIVNRVALIMVTKDRPRLLRWGLFLFIGLVNISVFCIWIPAMLRSGPQWVRINHVWERVEKSIFLVVDLGLNIYFLYLVRSQLIEKGLTKYWPLYNFNAGIILISTSMDIALLGLQSLPNAYDYIQFAPVAYTAKLHIELSMAELISKVVRGRNRVDASDDWTSDGTVLSSHIQGGTKRQTQTLYAKGEMEIDERSEAGLVGPERQEGILKTVAVVQTETRDGESGTNSERGSMKGTAVA
ncbi:hypothetical protein EJ06DRAFT_510063 [Trichodelitschia bisporula]|uniref:Integral membrane protein n=1 Tax=Trichodelitschia bisporula TaxID=703511 RepID=A0A6G1HYP2_9PEZI|nr:hypothetical protein EJ06DRAFT_510063 [Trichodelitschia bisporula]